MNNYNVSNNVPMRNNLNFQPNSNFQGNRFRDQNYSKSPYKKSPKYPKMSNRREQPRKSRSPYKINNINRYKRPSHSPFDHRNQRPKKSRSPIEVRNSRNREETFPRIRSPIQNEPREVRRSRNRTPVYEKNHQNNRRNRTPVYERNNRNSNRRYRAPVNQPNVQRNVASYNFSNSNNIPFERNSNHRLVNEMPNFEPNVRSSNRYSNTRRDLPSKVLPNRIDYNKRSDAKMMNKRSNPWEERKKRSDAKTMNRRSNPWEERNDWDNEPNDFDGLLNPKERKSNDFQPAKIIRPNRDWNFRQNENNDGDSDSEASVENGIIYNPHMLVGNFTEFHRREAAAYEKRKKMEMKEQKNKSNPLYLERKLIGFTKVISDKVRTGNKEYESLRVCKFIDDDPFLILTHSEKELEDRSNFRGPEGKNKPRRFEKTVRIVDTRMMRKLTELNYNTGKKN